MIKVSYKSFYKYLPSNWVNVMMLFMLVLPLLNQKISAQNIDSVKKLVSKLPREIDKLRKLEVLIDAEYNIAIWPKYNAMMLEIVEENLKKPRDEFISKNKLNHYKGEAYNNLGFLYCENLEFEKALLCHKKALKIRTSNGNELGVANSENNLGMISQLKGDYQTAIIRFKKSLYIYEANLSKPENSKQEILQSIAVELNNLATCFQELGNEKVALTYFQKSLDIKRQNSDYVSLAVGLNNLAIFAFNLTDTVAGMKYLAESLAISESNNFSDSRNTSLYILGNHYSQTGNYMLGEKYLFKALDFSIQSDDDYLNTRIKLSLCKGYIGQKNYDKAKILAKEVEFVAKKLEMTNSLETVYTYLNLIALHEKDFKSALMFKELQNELTEKMINAQAKKEVLNVQIGYQYEKAKIVANIREKNKRKIEQNQLIALLVGAFFLSAVGFLVVRGFRKNRRMSKIIKTQKSLVESKSLKIEEKQNETIINISYARRIQQSLLPSETVLQENFPNHFLIFKPKAIVSGDFYWTKNFNDEVTGLMIADSTGHGVPGAMMSILNISSLDKSIVSSRIQKPHEILNEARTHIIKTLNKLNQKVAGNDGMDGSLILYNKKLNTIDFSGANNDLLIIRNQEVLNFKGNNFPIGKHHHDNLSFTSETIQLEKNDIVYLFTDGYADQFGGEKNKKLKTIGFKKLLLAYCNLPILEQKIKLEEAFEHWKNENEQVDDVTLFGWKFEG